MKISCPKVSVIMPVYNGAAYLAEAIDSVLCQTYPNIEILVINDGSCDDGATERLALSYGDKIRYFSKENGGVSSALNRGIAEMTGDYFSWLSHDDAYEPDKIEKQVRMLVEKENEKTVCLCGSYFIDKHSQVISSRKALAPCDDGDTLPPEKALLYMLNNGAYNGCALLIPKVVFDVCGNFREDLRYSQDALMWTKIFLGGSPLVYTAYRGVKSRIHEAQQTHTKRELFRHDSLEIAKEIGPVLAQKREEKLLLAFVKRNALHGNRDVVAYCRTLAKETKLFSLGDKVSLLGKNVQGMIRPVIRKLYYRLFMKTKTQ